ncbi:MAG: right-handed parallel beta-helix repeat-containing protein [Candidatus Methanoperedens sp.]|nr:right-handed parallel beta-helix repeat-containing protein [Candidatus Methanoperedens sp.]MCZ7404800.1 right-handed parallel beta-helix repeat-containing protein [Candidatus Methanoperedens sp.]
MRKMHLLKIVDLISIIILLTGLAQAATITVCSSGCDYTNIQEAINSAISSDTIEVHSGTYYENVNVNKQLILRGVDTGGGKPVIDAQKNGDAIKLSADATTLEGFTAINSGIYGSGIAVTSSFNILNSNDVSNNNNAGISFHYSSNNILVDNTANSNNWSGIALIDSSNNNLLRNNTASNNNDSGIRLDFSSNNNTLRDNNANSNLHYGIALYSSSKNNTLRGNTALNNAVGILLSPSCDNNILISNNASSNLNRGIALLSNDNTLRDNKISNNPIGIRINSSSNNHIYNNYFNNANNIGSIIYSNTWNVTITVGTNIIGGSYVAGNMWANPGGTGFSQTCADADSDGICDSPYILDSNNIDYLPLAYTGWTPTTSVGYSALVATGQNTYVQSTNGTFGLLLKGQSKIINNSVVLNNTGDIAAKVEARFNDSISGDYGLVSGINLLNATNFALGIPSALMPLSNLGTDVQVAVAPPGVTALDARLGVPSDAVEGDYSGTVVLTFSNNV